MSSFDHANHPVASKFKRETSVSVADLQLNSTVDSIKRLELTHDGVPISMNVPTPNVAEPQSQAILTIMSNARDDFNTKYELMREIGRGGFSTVYQCRERSNINNVYAVKIIDLRPLRLRERFNPQRLRREVDIMKRLNHSNIVKFIEVFETPDSLMMVMEYCPGEELFDVILARKYFTEEDAKPIFVQITKALYYLHSLNIIHRDIKPENVLILHDLDPASNLPVAKLLDFGLSKNAGAGSAAKTFVGTPCYLSPEVEYTSKGIGGTYGLPADCWSLGAVLYVMLVARFPEFEQDVNGKVVLRLPPALWNDISSDAKDLIRGLMNANPNARYTTRRVLQHPWLGQYRVSDEELNRVTISTYDLCHGLQEEEEEIMLSSPGTNDEYNQTLPLVLRSNTNSLNASQLQLHPLLHLQRKIEACFKESHRTYVDNPEMGAIIRKGAMLCREQFEESTKLLIQIDETAKEVLKTFSDIVIAVEENEPRLATITFDLYREWVVSLKEAVTRTKDANKLSMNHIQSILEKSAIGIQTKSFQSKMHNITETLLQLKQQTSNNELGEQKTFTQDEVLDLFLNLFVPPTSSNNVGGNTNMSITETESFSLDNNSNVHITDISDIETQFVSDGVVQDHFNTNLGYSYNSYTNQPLAIQIPDANPQTMVRTAAPSSPAASHLVEALHKLHEVDNILEKLTYFWAQTEVRLDILTKKGQHVEQFIGFASKPRLLARFKERLEEYKRFWEDVETMSSSFILGIQPSAGLYTFLDENSMDVDRMKR